MRRAPGLVSALTPALVAVVLLSTSCTSSSSQPDTKGDETSAPTRIEAFGPSQEAASITEEELVAALATGGIETYAAAADGEPVVPVEDPGPLSVTGWQALTMQRQLNSGQGYVGRDLDALAAESAGEIPVSVVLAAWVSAAQTPGAGVARDLMGERDWANRALDIVYPDAVIALFVNDLAGDQATASSAPLVVFALRSW